MGFRAEANLKQYGCPSLPAQHSQKGDSAIIVCISNTMNNQIMGKLFINSSRLIISKFI